MNIIFKIIIIVAVLLGLVLLGTSIFNKYFGDGRGFKVNPSETQLPINVSEKDEKEIKELAENFVRTYKTYQLGDFSGLESLQSCMTTGLWEKKFAWITSAKLEAEKQPKRYITYFALVKNSIIISNSKNNAEVEVNYTQKETKVGLQKLENKFVVFIHLSKISGA